MTVDVSKQLDRAKRFLEKNRVEDAIEDVSALLSESPGHLESLQALGDFYTRLGQMERSTNYYGLLFDRFCDVREENKASAIYTRALKGVQQPAERMARYALLLQKQNRVGRGHRAVRAGLGVVLARGQEEPALDCLERVAQLDPDNADAAIRRRRAGQRALGRMRRRRARFCGRRSLPKPPAMLTARWNCWRARTRFLRANAARRCSMPRRCCGAATRRRRRSCSSRGRRARRTPRF